MIIQYNIKLLTMEILLNKKYKINSEKIVWSELPNEIIITDKMSNEIFGLKGIARKIWLLLKESNSVLNIIDDLSSYYDVENNILQSDIEEFIAGLLKMKLIF